ALTIHIGTAPAEVTGHPGSRTTSYLQPGRWVTTAELPDAVMTDHWYVIAGLEVVADGAAVVTLGNSITDGRGSGTNRNNRWPDNLARRLQADPRTGHVAVLNAGIGGNTVISGGLGPTALARLDRDVLAQAGARWVILLEGVNDIGGARAPGQAAAVARNLVVAYRDIIDRVHARGLRIYGATIPPFGGSQYDGDERGAAVAILGRRREAAEAKAAAIRREGGDASVLIADVLDEGQLEGARDRLLEARGRVDILVNAAGGNVARARSDNRPAFDVPLDALDEVLRLNLHGTLIPSFLFGAVMGRQASGSIVNISSMAARRVLSGVLGYSIAKAGIDTFTQWLAAELARRYGDKVRVNAVAPGFFVTEQNRSVLVNPDGSYTQRARAIIAHTPM